MKKKNAAFALALALFLPLGHAAELRVGGGVDVIHKPGMAMVTASVGPASLLAWDNRNYGLALTSRFGPHTGWSGAAGGILVDRTDDDVGTRLNFALQANYCGSRWCLGYLHISHGSSLGIRRHSANSGLNFVFVEYRIAYP